MNESQLSQTSVKSERESARDVCLKLLPQFLKDAMMVVQATSGEDDQAHVHAESVARATLAICLAVDSLDKMYDQCIYDSLMEATHGKEAFLLSASFHTSSTASYKASPGQKLCSL